MNNKPQVGTILRNKKTKNKIWEITKNHYYGETDKFTLKHIGYYATEYWIGKISFDNWIYYDMLYIDNSLIDQYKVCKNK